MQTIIFLGPDRVGKTTLINRTFEYLAGINEVPTMIRNFKEISPSHHSPMQQFRDVLNEFSENRPDFLLLGRFVSDTLFYEERRGQMPPIDPACAVEIESMLHDMADELKIVLLETTWENVKDRHLKELSDKYPHSSLYWKESQLQLRKQEHADYYKHTYEYIKNNDFYSGIRTISPSTENTVFDYWVS